MKFQCKKKKKKNDGKKVVKVFSKFLFQDFLSIRRAGNFFQRVRLVGEVMSELEIYNFK